MYAASSNRLRNLCLTLSKPAMLKERWYNRCCRDVCLNRWVLEIASLVLKTKAGKSYRTLNFSAKVSRVNQSELLVATMLLHEIPCLLLKKYTYFLKHDVQVHSKYNSNAVKKKNNKSTLCVPYEYSCVRAADRRIFQILAKW